MKIYTKKGDEGATSLVGGARVSKDDLRVEAYGTVDELMAHLAYLMDQYCEQESSELQRILGCLMTASCLLATESGCTKKLPYLNEDEVAFLEQRIDAMNETLPAIDKFTLPGGHPAVSMAHICRTVCRRAERSAVRAGREYEVSDVVLAYLNRLSDYLYTLGRVLSLKFNAKEIFWILDM